MLLALPWLTAFLLALALLRLVAGPRRVRYRQAFSPPLSLIYGLAAGAWYADALAPLHAVALRLAELFAPSGWALSLGAQPVLAFNWMLLTGYIPVKLAGNVVTVASLRLIRRDAQRPASGSDPDPKLLLSPAYELSPEGIVLDPRWLYSRQVCSGLAGVALLQLMVCTHELLLEPSFAVPALPALPLLFFLEASFYLGGPRRSHAAQRLAPEAEQSAAFPPDYSAVWQRYQELWPERVLFGGTFTWNTGGPGQDASLAAMERDLDAGRNVLIKADEFTPVLPSLARRARCLLAEGGVILILVERSDEALSLAQALIRDPVDPAADRAARRVADLANFLQDRQQTDVLVATPTALLLGEVVASAWFEQLRLVIIANTETAFSSISTLDGLLCQIRARTRGSLQHILLSHERHAIQPAVGRNLSLDTVEHRVPSPMREQVWIQVWRTEGEPWFQQRLLNGHVGTYLGNEMTLALPAWKAGLTPIRVYGVATVPWYEQQEELQNELARLRPEWQIDPDREGLVRDRLQVSLTAGVLRPEPEGCVVIRDAVANLSTALALGMAKGRGRLLLHVVSPPYLLRDYLAANLDYFLAAPLRALCPRRTAGLATIADALWQRLAVAEMEELAVLTALHEYDPSVKWAELGLHRLFLEAYGIDVLRDGTLRIRVEAEFRDTDGEGGCAETVLLSLAREAGVGGIRARSRLYRLGNEHGEVLGVVSEDRLSQLYLPGQVHVFGGRAYRIGRVDQDASILRLDHCQPRGEPRYRRALTVRIATCRPIENAEASLHVRRNGLLLIRELCACDFTVTTHGYFVTEDTLRSAGTGIGYVDLEGGGQAIPDRHWPLGRALRFCFQLPEEVRGEWSRLAFTLASLWSEVMPTLLPEVHSSVLVGTMLPDGFFTTPELGKWFPRFVGSAGGFPDTAGELLEIFVLEDARQDTGAIQCLFDKYELVFEVLYDYLVWFLTERSAGDLPDGPLLPPGLAAMPPEVDLPGVLELLRRLALGCGPESLNTHRTAFRAASDTARPAH